MAQVTNTFPDNGNTGIGTTSPSSKLHLVSGATTGQPGIKLDWTYSITNGPNFLEINGKPPTGSLKPFLVLDNMGRLQVGSTAGAVGDRLVVDGPIKLTNAGDAAGRKINAGTLSRVFEINANTSSTDGANIELYGKSHNTTPGEIHFSSYGATSAPGIQFNSYDPGGTTWRSTMTLTGDNRVLIGNVIGSTAMDKLIVENDLRLTNIWDDKWRRLRAGTLKQGLEIAANTNSADGPNIELHGAQHDTRAGRIHINTCGPSSSETAMEFNNYDPSKGTWVRTMTLTKDNRVWIGQIPAGQWLNEYKLGVGGTIVAKRVVVQIDNWYDCVFNNAYQLRPLSEVATFIKDHNHLPDVPAENEVLERGVDVGDMNAILLKKVEELTLYLIQQQKEIEQLKQQIKK